MENEQLVWSKQPTVSFNMEEIKLENIQDVIKKTRIRSAPAPAPAPDTSTRYYIKCIKSVQEQWDDCKS